jgi:hypothetical protein
MKNKHHSHALAWLTIALAPLTAHALEVHEWGTFTMLSSSNGQPTRWYQPYSDLAELPRFARRNISRLKEGAATVRMETPVLYFYPEKEMDISVSVSFAYGKISERFPASLPNPALLESLAQTPPFAISLAADTQAVTDAQAILHDGAYWSGKLLPPDHSDAQLIPAVPTSHRGDNYAAARHVPEAWIFRSHTPVIKTENQPDIHPVEKFIFYRGLGESRPLVRASMSDSTTFHFTNDSEAESSFQIALQVTGDRATYIKMPSVPRIDKKLSPEKQITSVSAQLPKETISLAQADKELSALFLAELTARGLTDAEAKAMIATWNHTWFAEPGTRVFTIVDRAWLDQVLPLEIKPTPKNIERVFVARLEIVSPSTETQLCDLLLTKSISDDHAAQLQAMQLGRFLHGAVEIARDKTSSQMFTNFYDLKNRIDQKVATQPAKLH